MGAALLDWLWITGSLGLIGALLVSVWALAFYLIAFPWRQYPLGPPTANHWASILSLTLPGFAGLFLDPIPSVSWWEAPDGRELWTIALRAASYLYVTFAVLWISRILWQRKFHPERSPELYDPVYGHLFQRRNSEAEIATDVESER